MVGKNAMRSINVANKTDHNTFFVRSYGRIDRIAKAKQILSKFVISFVPYLPLRERRSVKSVRIAATPGAQDPGPPSEPTIVVTMDQMSHVYV
jgi:hypothetical protein